MIMTVPEKKSSNIKLTGFFLIAVCFLTACGKPTQDSIEKPPIVKVTSEPIRKLLESAQKQTSLTTEYSQQYFVLDYPNGDPPAQTGACTDVVIRAFRNAGIDLQKEVHEDMAANFSLYPKKWGLVKTDTNIDHRRVPNLQKFFDRKGKSISVTLDGEDYSPGDVVSWDLDGKGMTHIGIVSNYWNQSSKRYSIVHNIGGGVHAEDRLFEWKITGHYRYF
jgi:uncharacterized protein YijF (DUF1287 family)